MRHHRVILIIMVIGIASFLTGCASTPTVKRMDVDKIVDISGRWNDTDSRLVAEDMIRDCLKRPFLERFKNDNNKIPTAYISCWKAENIYKNDYFRNYGVSPPVFLIENLLTLSRELDFREEFRDIQNEYNKVLFINPIEKKSLAVRQNSEKLHKQLELMEQKE